MGNWGFRRVCKYVRKELYQARLFMLSHTMSWKVDGEGKQETQNQKKLGPGTLALTKMWMNLREERHHQVFGLRIWRL